MAKKNLEYWTVWYSKAAATGLLIGRGLIEPARRLILHAAPPVITAEVNAQTGERLAYGQDLEQTSDTPMCLLWREGDQIKRRDIWPDQEHYGTLVLLPGGEVGTLKEWWNAEDHKEWRWQVEFYNSLRG